MTEAISWLLSSAGRRGALTQLLQATPTPNRNRVVAVDASPLSAAGRLADVFEQVPRADDPDFIEQVLAVAKRHDVQHVIPTIDPELHVYAQARDAFEAANIRVWVSTPSVIEIANDKWRLHTWLTQSNFPTVRTIEATNPTKASVHGPVIAKPRAGSSSIGILEAANFASLPPLSSDYIIQEKATGIEFTVDFGVTRSGRFAGCIPRRRLETRAGEVSKGVTVAVPEIEELTREVAHSLHGAFGILNMQVFFEPATRSINIIEINPRFGGGYPLSHAAGGDLISAVLGDSQDDLRWRPGTVMLRYDTAIFYNDPSMAGA